MAVVWNDENAAHLLRRVAFGGTPEQIQAFRQDHDSVESAVDELLSWKPSKRKPPGPNRDPEPKFLRKMQRWWVKQMLKSRTPRDGALEKLVLFLHDHLACGMSKQPNAKYMSIQNRLFRYNAKGSFKHLIREFNRDPANLYYLDGILNVASNDGVHVHANENWARELLELFTLGVFQFGDDGTPDPTKPNYTEDDVHQLARATTGWTSIEKGVGVFNIEDWDGGQYDDDGDDLPDDITIFGVTRNGFRMDEAVIGTSDDLVELIFSQVDDEGNNQVAMLMAWKLWRWYAYPPPAPGLKSLLASFAQVFVNNDFGLEHLLRAIWTSDEFFSDAAKSRTVRNPVDVVVQSMRAMGVRKVSKYMPGSYLEVGEQLDAMGMVLFEPPNVAGWPGGLSWITSGTLFERFRFARDFAEADSGGGRIRFKDLPDLGYGNPAADPAAVVDAIISQVGLDTGPLAINATQRDVLMDAATAGGVVTSIDFSSEKTGDVYYLVRPTIALALQMAENQMF
jgi:uncharacterized protein (DUF1800 family)